MPDRFPLRERPERLSRPLSSMQSEPNRKEPTRTSFWIGGGITMNRKKGFTLIELLVVIAIIAVLMAVLMPSLTRVRKQARAVACQARLKSWGFLRYFLN